MVEGSFLSGTTDSTGTGSSTGSTGASGPSGSSGSSGGVSKDGPGRSQGKDQDVNHGPGVSGSSRNSGSPAGSTGEVSLEAPHASVTPRNHNLVMTGIGVGKRREAVLKIRVHLLIRPVLTLRLLPAVQTQEGPAYHREAAEVIQV